MKPPGTLASGGKANLPSTHRYLSLFHPSLDLIWQAFSAGMPHTGELISNKKPKHAPHTIIMLPCIYFTPSPPTTLRKTLLHGLSDPPIWYNHLPSSLTTLDISCWNTSIIMRLPLCSCPTITSMGLPCRVSCCCCCCCSFSFC